MLIKKHLVWVSLLRSRFWDVKQRSPQRNFFFWRGGGGALREIPKTAAKETMYVVNYRK